MEQKPIDAIQPATWNPRTRADEAALDALTQSVQQHGIIQPIVVRPCAADAAGADLQVVAGTRRLTAAQRAGLTAVPVVVRELDDAAAAEVAMAENIQDEAMGPLDEARGYRHILDESNKKGFDVLYLSGRLGVPVSRIRRRLRLLELSQPVLDALDQGRITIAHADLITRVPVAQQPQALGACKWDLFQYSDGTEAAPVSQLRRWIGDKVKVELEPEVVEDYFPELVTDDATADALPTLLKLSESHHVNVDLDTRKHGLIGQGRWIEIGLQVGRKKVRNCKHAQDGVVVHGGPVRVVRVCATPKCPVHRPEPKKAAAGGAGGGPATPRPESEWERQEREREEARQAWEVELPTVLKAFAEHVADLPVTIDLIRRVVHTDRTETRLEAVLGAEWKPEENIGQLLACAAVLFNAWARDHFKEAAAEYGFKMPRKPRAKKAAKPADAAGDETNGDTEATS